MPSQSWRFFHRSVVVEVNHSFHIQLVEDSIRPETYQSRIHSIGCGARMDFHGVIRPSNYEKTVTGIEFDCFQPLAIKMFHQLAQEVSSGDTIQSFPTSACDHHSQHDRGRAVIGGVIVHRLGWVPAGEASVYMAVHSHHRREAFEGLWHLIEGLKTRVPIWKKEVYADGTHLWLRGVSLR